MDTGRKAQAKKKNTNKNLKHPKNTFLSHYYNTKQLNLYQQFLIALSAIQLYINNTEYTSINSALIPTL